MNNSAPIVSINAKTISDAWFQLIWNIFDNCYTQNIQAGSFENEQYRLQYPGIAVFIEHPNLDMIPIIPPALGIPSPTSMEYVESYFADYIMDPTVSENETYRYSSRIHNPMPGNIDMGIPPLGTQFDRVVAMLRKSPYTNQAVIEVGSPQDHDVCYGKDQKLDPPCLRLIDFKVIPVRHQWVHKAGVGKVCSCGRVFGDNDEPCNPVENILTETVYFRSWDLWAGFPSNLAGLELLKQLVAQEAGLKSGYMYAYSAGAHIYGYQEDFARIRTMKGQK
jgi:thymidylate synthase